MSKKIKFKQGDKIGRWEILCPAPSKQGASMYTCRCECGSIKDVCAKNLKYKKTLSCGCYARDAVRDNAPKRIKNKNKLDLTGKKFGELTVIKKENAKTGVNAKWLCSCSCGNTTVVIQSGLTSGCTTSCGCVHKKKASGRIKKNMGIVEGTNVSHILSKKVSKSNTSGIRGVSFRKAKGKYQAYIGFKGKLYNLGYFSDIKEAAEARKKAEDEIYGDFLNWYFTNFPQKKETQ